MTPERRALFETAWIKLQAKKIYVTLSDKPMRAPRSIIYEVHSRHGVKGVALLYKLLAAMGVEKKSDSRLCLQEIEHD